MRCVAHSAIGGLTLSAMCGMLSSTSYTRTEHIQLYGCTCRWSDEMNSTILATCRWRTKSGRDTTYHQMPSTVAVACSGNSSSSTATLTHIAYSWFVWISAHLIPVNIAISLTSSSPHSTPQHTYHNINSSHTFFVGPHYHTSAYV